MKSLQKCCFSGFFPLLMYSIMSFILDFYHRDTLYFIVLMLPYIHLFHRFSRLTILPLIEFYTNSSITKKANINKLWHCKDETTYIPWQSYYVLKLTCFAEALYYLDTFSNNISEGNKIIVTYLPKSKLILSIHKSDS